MFGRSCTTPEGGLRQLLSGIFYPAYASPRDTANPFASKIYYVDASRKPG